MTAQLFEDAIAVAACRPPAGLAEDAERIARHRCLAWGVLMKARQDFGSLAAARAALVSAAKASKRDRAREFRDP